MTPQEIKALKAERDALAAWVNDACALFTRITQSEEAVINNDVKNIIDSELMYDISDFVEYKTPQQCLRDVQAEAGRAGFIAGFNESGEGFNGEYGASEKRISVLAGEYAESVRKGGAE